jgi:F-box interacting protein
VDSLVEGFQMAHDLLAAVVSRQEEEEEEDEGETAAASSAFGEGMAKRGLLVLDPKIWGKLPEELLERVLLHLPLQSLARMRTICKKWDHYVFTSAFTKLRAQIWPQKPWIVMTSTEKSLFVYDSGLDTWHQVPIPFNAHELHVVAAAGGLLCFSNAWFQWPRMYVCNPMTQKWRRLPPMNTWMISTVGMVYEEEAAATTPPAAASSSFKVLVCGRLEDHSMITEVYDSITNSWTIGGNPSPARKHGGHASLWCDGIFYCLTFPFSTLCLLAYNLRQGAWYEVPVRMPAPIMSPSLVECKGRLMLVGGLEEEHSVFVIQIWELDSSEHKWVELERMPSQLCKDFVTNMVPSKPLSCFATGDFIFLMIPSSNNYMPALMFNLTHRTWDWWPTSDFPTELPELNIGQSSGISFEPRLDASVF